MKWFVGRRRRLCPLRRISWRNDELEFFLSSEALHDPCAHVLAYPATTQLIAALGPQRRWKFAVALAEWVIDVIHRKIELACFRPQWPSLKT